MSPSSLDALAPAHHHDRPLHLGDAINVATRGVHAKLNKLILQYLPLALPPHARDPSAYATGILHIAPIYIAFETMWQRYLDSRDSAGSLCGEGETPERIQAVLARVHLPAMLRSESLRSDIGALAGWTQKEVNRNLREVGRTGYLGQFVSHTKRTLNRRPHALLAYAWVLYMALFSGGRFIRQSLEQCSQVFWEEPLEFLRTERRPLRCAPSAHYHVNRQRLPSCLHETVSPSASNSATPRPASSDSKILHLSFFRFDTPHDGEDFKVAFKAQFLEAEALLTAEECDHIVKEAICIFDNMILLVQHLQDLFDGDEAAGNESPTSPARPASPACLATSSITPIEGLANLLSPLLGTRLRDSVAVAKDRARQARKVKLLRLKQQGHSSEDSSSEDPMAQPRPRCPSAAAITGVSMDVYASGMVTPAQDIASKMIAYADATGKLVHFEQTYSEVSKSMRKAGKLAATGTHNHSPNGGG